MKYIKVLLCLLSFQVVVLKAMERQKLPIAIVKNKTSWDLEVGYTYDSMEIERVVPANGLLLISRPEGISSFSIQGHGDWKTYLTTKIPVKIDEIKNVLARSRDADRGLGVLIEVSTEGLSRSLNIDIKLHAEELAEQEQAGKLQLGKIFQKVQNILMDQKSWVPTMGPVEARHFLGVLKGADIKMVYEVYSMQKSFFQGYVDGIESNLPYIATDEAKEEALQAKSFYEAVVQFLDLSYSILQIEHELDIKKKDLHQLVKQHEAALLGQ